MWPFACYHCGLLVQVAGDPEEFAHLIIEHDQWKRGWPCFTTGCGSELCKLGPYQAAHWVRHAMQMSPQEFFRALCGGGAPEEIDCRPEIVRAFLLSAKIIQVDARASMGDGRTCIDRIYLDNNMVLHLSGTSAGALVYKVTKHVQASSRLAVRSETGDGTVRRPLECADTVGAGESREGVRGVLRGEHESDAGDATPVPPAVAGDDGPRDPEAGSDEVP